MEEQQQASAQPSPLPKEMQERLEKLKTRENGYNINNRLYVCFRCYGTFMLPFYALLLFYYVFINAGGLRYHENQYFLNEIFMDRFIETEFYNSDSVKTTYKDINNIDDMWDADEPPPLTIYSI